MFRGGIILTASVGVFAKHWTPGQTKTRLAASIGEATAAECAKHFLTTTMCRLQSLGEQHVLAYSPSERHAEFLELLSVNQLAQWRLIPQSTGDLGDRMEAYFQSSYESGAEVVVLLGSDSPDFPIEALDKGIRWLIQRDQRGLFLGPSNDGGYWAIGMRGQVAPIFQEMPWSESSLFNETLKRLNAHGWQEGTDFLQIDSWYDVDDLQDLKMLNERLDNLSEQGESLASLFEQIHRITSS